MKFRNRVFLVSLSLCFITTLLLLIISRNTANKVELRLGHSLDTGHVVHKSLEFFKQELHQLSDGNMQVEIYPSGQLGSERDMVELLQIGSLAMTKVSAGALETFVPELKVFSLPYVFRDSEHYWQTLNSPIGETLLDSTLPAKLKGLAYLDAGTRSFYTCSKPVHSADDLVGSKIRTMKSQSAVALMEALGASATPISFGELYTALQQGVVDGAENNVITFYKSKHFEVCKHFALDEHNAIPDMIIISEHIWQSLSLQQQHWVNVAMKKTTEYQKQLWQVESDIAMTAITQAGVQVTFPDKSEFAQRVSQYKASFANSKVGELLERIAAL